MPVINILFLTCPRTINVHKSKHVSVNCSLCVQSGVGVRGRLHCVVCSVLTRWCIINLTAAVSLGVESIGEVGIFSGVVVNDNLPPPTVHHTYCIVT
jgi:hypothetical protein